jgi:hypothetical protein
MRVLHWRAFRMTGLNDMRRIQCWVCALSTATLLYGREARATTRGMAILAMA